MNDKTGKAQKNVKGKPAKRPAAKAKAMTTRPPKPRAASRPRGAVRDAEAQWSRATKLDPSLFQHPEDAAAREKLEAVPGFKLLARKVLEFGYESLYHGLFMGNYIRLSPRQLPEIYNLLPRLRRQLRRRRAFLPQVREETVEELVL